MAQLLNLNLTSLVIMFISLMSILYQVEPSSLIPKPADQSSMAYIRASCKTTLYSNLCIQSLSKFGHYSPLEQNPQQLPQIALSVSHSRALQTRAYLLGLSIQLNNTMKKNDLYLDVQNCLNQINDSVDQLGQSIQELRRMNLPKDIVAVNIDDNFLWHISNVETWVSAALTDASTCVNLFNPDSRMSKVKAGIRVRALNVAQVTSNALALFHGYAANDVKV
ncbi:pectinesterase inhibitor 9-like [Senna tora]|uniref:Pectinesterase inhibitor 9-like n=1 Tax=Senna tora TaxID=362788 RepID=A0A834TWB0_9FABA|nr:pectinesterase inhibitor 9-like [Senna tora]